MNPLDIKHWIGIRRDPEGEEERRARRNQFKILDFCKLIMQIDRLCGLVVRVSGYRYRGPGFDSRRYQIF